MNIFCTECGVIPKGHYDGYGVGDRLLEGVMFEVEVVGDKLISKGVELRAKDYMSDLNEAKWLEKVNLSLEDEILEGGDGINCPDNRQHEVMLINDDGTELTITESLPVKKTTVKVFKGKMSLQDYLDAGG